MTAPQPTPAPPIVPPGEDWKDYRKLLIHRLDELSEGQTALRGDVAGLREDMVALKLKAGLWGAFAGLIPVLIALGIALAVKVWP